MLTLITGMPGAGKTAAMVDLLVQELKDRPLYVDGVDGLNIDHTELDVTKWHEVVPDGAAIAVDEAQRRWRPAGPGAKVTPDVAELETHRHRGVDLFITTQHPKLINQNVRNLVGRHVHIRDLGILGRWWYEWPEATDPGTWRSAPIKKRYRLPKRVFDKYKSASMHVKPIRSFPWMLGVLIVAVVLGLWAAWMAAGAINRRLHGEYAAAPAAAASAPRAAAPAVSGAQPGQKPDKFAAYLSDRSAWVPRYSAQPESAPAFDEVRKVRAMPVVVGGWCQGDECHCVTQQGTNAGLSPAECRAWIASPSFDPYLVRVPVMPAAPSGQDSPKGISPAV